MQARFHAPGQMIDWVADADYSSGDVIQVPDGRCGVVSCDIKSGYTVGVHISGIFEVTKTTSMVLLRGGRAFWDFSALKSHFRKVNDRDLYMGRVTDDATSSSTSAYIAINVNPPPDIDVLRDAALSVATGTKAAGGFDLPKVYGNARGLSLTATNEAQGVDILSVDRFDKASNAIIEAIFRLGVNGSTSDVDLNVGIANGTSTTDADATTEHVLFHIDGGSLVLNLQSKDGTTTNAAATTGVSVTAGSAVSDRCEVWIDTRDPADVQCYVNGALVLPSSVFRIDAATGPFGLLAHAEKISGTATAGPWYIDRLEARYMKA